jgi:predicted Fe-Mo cluster-binding NifX family protein
MNKIRVCIGSDDGVSVALSHMGDMKYFYIYDISKDNYAFIEKRLNTMKQEGHATSNKMQIIQGILKDTNAFVARVQSPNFKKLAANTRFQPIIVNMEKLEDILAILIKEFEQISTLVQKREEADFVTSIPKFQ